MKVELTKAQIDAVLLALGNHLESDEDALALWVHPQTVSAVERAVDKLIEALRGEANSDGE